MSGLAATMRSAACWRSSAQLRTVRGAGSAPPRAPPAEGAATATVGEDGARVDSPGPRSGFDVEQATSANAEKTTAAPTLCRVAARSDSMQRTVDLLGELARNTIDRLQVLDTCRPDAARATEALQQPCPLLRADARNLLERAGAGTHARAARAHAGDREPVRLVADLRDEHQRRRVATERDFRPPVGEDELLEPDLAALALLDADDAPELDAELLEHRARDADLAAAAIDENEIGKPRLPLRRGLDELGVATRQHLAHRRIVVARRDAGDVEAAVLRALHLVRLEDDARRLRRLARGVADVEAFDPERVHVLDGEVERIDERARTRLLRTLLGEQLREAKRR